MPVKAHAPETCASTNSAIPAKVVCFKSGAKVTVGGISARLFFNTIKIFFAWLLEDRFGFQWYGFCPVEYRPQPGNLPPEDLSRK